jgi:hypothetical protein
MLTRRVTSEGEPTPVHSYLVHCVTSATSIIAIFNLFVRSYSINYCVLSLSYTVYIAATIYLLQVQAYPDDHQARQRLDFCIRSLNEVKQYSPMIGGALNLLNKELAALGLNLGSLQPVAAHTPSSTASGTTPAPNHFFADVSTPHQPPTNPVEYLFQFHGGLEGFGPGPMAMEAGVFEAMSTLEPLSAYVGTIHEYDHHSTPGSGVHM